jgi:glycosyltransferase involved in cell wall biosynthesis
MTATPRIYFDASFTRTQVGNVGITRTVRRLLEAMNSPDALERISCQAVAFHSTGFRRVEMPVAATAGGASSTSQARTLRWLSGGWVRRAVSAFVPLPLLHRSWMLYNKAAFDRLGARGTPAEFCAGDWLIIGDQAWNYPSWNGAASARAKGAKVILIVYDLIPLSHPQFCNPLFTRVFGQWLYRMLDTTDAVLCISRATEAALREYCRSAQRRLPPTTHFRLGGDQLPDGGTSEVRSSLSGFIASVGCCFVAVGSFEPRKNYGFLLDVFETLWAEGHGFGLLVMGRMNEESHSVIERFRRHGEIGKRLMCVFDASDGEISYAYGRCRALVFPSLAEGFGLPLVEARMQGCPVIASDLPSLAELADEGVRLFSPGSQAELRQLLLESAATPQSVRPRRMTPFGWRESASQLLSRTSAALDKHLK